jgi:uncharacterized protein (UPF0335 family)
MEDTIMSKTINEKIEAAQEEKRQLEAHIKQLLQQQKARERKDRNHRLCKRGGLVEKLLPDLANLTDEQFQTFVDKTLLTGFAGKILRGLVPQKSEAAAKQNGNTDTAQGNGNAAAESVAAASTEAAPSARYTGAVHNPGANDNHKSA